MFQEMTIIGNLTRDPVLRYLPTGTAVVDFNVAVNGTKKVNGSNVKTTMWFKVAAWNKQAEAINQYLVKGSSVMVKGELIADEFGNPPTWTNKSGEVRAEFKINASTVKFLSKASGHVEDDAPAEGDGDDDMPF